MLNRKSIITKSTIIIFFILIFFILIFFVFSSNYNKKKSESLGELEVIANRESNLSNTQIELIISKFCETEAGLDEEIILDESEILKNMKFLNQADSTLLNKIISIKSVDDSLASIFVFDNQDNLYFLYLKLLNEFIRLKYIGGSESMLTAVNTRILWIVSEMDKLSKEVFMKKQLEFYQGLSASNYKNKLLIEYYKANSVGRHLDNTPAKAASSIAMGLILSKELNDTKAVLDFYRRIQFLLNRFYGFNSLALAFGKHILNHATEHEYYNLEAITYYYNGEALRIKGSYSSAFEQYNYALKIYQMHNYHSMVNFMKERIAIVYKHLGKFDLALSEYRLLLSQNADDYHRMLYYHGISQIYMKMGNFDKAGHFLEEALILCRQVNDLTNKVVFLGDMANLNLKLGYRTKARECIQEALQIPEDKVSPSPVIFAWHKLGELYLEQEDWQTAKLHLLKALDLSSKYNFGFQDAKIDLLLAELSLKTNVPDSAVYFLKNSIIKHDKIGDVTGKIETLTLAGEIYRKSKQYNLAEENLRKAQKLTQSLPQYANTWEINYNFAKLKIDLGELGVAEKYLEQSIGHIETLTTQLTDYEKRVTFAHKIQSPYEEMVLLLLQKGEIEAAFAYSDNSRAQVFKLLIEQNKNQPMIAAAGFVNLWRNDAPTLQNLQSLLDEKTAVLEYEITENELIVWCIRKNSFDVRRVEVTRVVTDSVVLAFKNEMDVKKVETEGKADSSYQRIKKSCGFLFSKFIKPVDALLSDIETLIVIPDENLHRLPFAALMDSDSTFLIQRFKIANAASADILVHSLEESDGVYNSSPKSLLTVSVDENGQAFEDSKKVRELFANSKSLLGQNATEESFISALNDAAYDRILLSLHGYLSDKPMHSYLKLYAPSDTIDSHLTVEDIMQQKMHGTDLVYMAACESASGRVFRGEGVISLQRAFMIARVKTIIGNLWSVESETTGELATIFFKNLKSYNKVEALQQAQLTTIDKFSDEEFFGVPHPYFWAPLTLSGAIN